MISQTILFTGHTGFIGRELSKALQAEGNRIVGLSASNGFRVEQASSFAKINKKQIDIVYHLAGRTFVPDSWETPNLFYSINTIGTQNVLDFCREYKTPLVYISSYVYGHPQKQPIDENHPVAPDNPYAHSKVLAEDLCRFYASTFGIPVAIVRPFNVFGVGQATHFLIPSVMKKALDHDMIEVANLTSRRDFIYLPDLVTALTQVRRMRSNFEIFNVASGISHSVQDVIQYITKKLCITKPITCTNTYRINEVLEVVGSSTKIQTQHGWTPQYSLEAGIEDMINIMQKQGSL